MLELTCSVRDCRAKLLREGRSFVCAHGHSFNIARSGYCNLLQPQDRRSREPGDARELVQARRRLFDAGHGVVLRAALVEMLARTPPVAGATALDAGCGEGYFLAELCAHFALDGCGIDISVHAIDAAAKRHDGVTWLVANADRKLPLADASVARVLSITGRRNAQEFRRVIADDGRLVIAVPAPDDQAELRAAVLGAAHELERMTKIQAELAGLFELDAQTQMRIQLELDAASVQDLLLATYRGARHSQRERAAALSDLAVTSSYEIACFRPR